MKKLVLSLLSLPLLSPFALHAAPAGDPTKSAYFDMGAVLERSPEYKDSMEELQKDYEHYENKLKNLQNKALKYKAQLEDTQLNKEGRLKIERELAGLQVDYQSALKEAQEDFAKRQRQVEEQLAKKIKRIIKETGKKNNWGAVTQAFVIINPDLDLTDEIVKALNESYAAEKKAAEQKKKVTQSK